LSSNRPISIVSLLLGLFALSFFLIFDKSKLVFNQSDVFLIRYLPAIFIANAAIVFIVFGILLYKRVLISYLSKSATTSERAKNEACIILLSIPIWISTSTYIFLECESGLMKAGWSIFMMFIVWKLISGLKLLTKRETSKTI
jgi:hypothetical protein